MRRILAALARIRLRANPVHRDVQRLVRLGAERAQRHARRHEALADRGDRFDLFQRHLRPQRLDVQKIAQMDRRVCPHFGRILLPKRIGRFLASRLQKMHGLRFPGVGLAGLARLVETADRQNAVALEPLRVDFLSHFLKAGYADPGNARVHAGEILRDHRPAQPHRLEVQPAAIGGDHADPHLRHDFQKTGVDRGAIARDGFGQRAVDQTPFDPVGDAVLGEVGIHGRRAAADKNREIMRVDTFSRPHIERTERPQPLARQPGMHGASRKDHRHRNVVRPRSLIGQHKMPGTRTHRVLGFGAETPDSGRQSTRSAVRRECAVNLDHVGLKSVLKALELRVADKRAAKHDDLGLAAVLIEHVFQVAEPGLQAHHPVFAQAVDRRVGDLAEVLAEEMRQRPVGLGQHRRRRVIAHGSHQFLAVLGHRRKDLLKLFNGISRSDLPPPQFAACEHRRFGDRLQFTVEVSDLADPFTEGL